MMVLVEGFKIWVFSVAKFRGRAVICRAAGFTLIELLVTIMVATILLTIAIPSFNSMVLANKLATATDDMVNAINTARMEAIKLNASTQFCSNNQNSNTAFDNSAMGARCGTQTGAVYATVNGNVVQVLAAANGIGSHSPVQLSGNVIALRFDSLGMGFNAGNASTPFGSSQNPVARFCVSQSQLSRNNIYSVMMAAGAIVTVNKSTGACP